MQRLVKEELGFCCIEAFLREVHGNSARKVAQALGVSHQVVRYWRQQKYEGNISRCPKCGDPQPQLKLQRYATGRWYFKKILPLRKRPRSNRKGAGKT